MRLSRLFLTIICIMIALTQINSCLGEGTGLLVYMLGCDLESERSAATDDLMEMLYETMGNPNLRITAYLGGCHNWWLPDMTEDHCYDVRIEQGKITILQDYGKQESSGSAQLKQFLLNYASDGDALILWGHGFRSQGAIGSDALFDDDLLTLEEITEALRENQAHFRLIGFDACEMATIKAMQMVAPFADYIAASPEKEELSGWDYHAVLQALTMDTGNLQKALRENVLQAAQRDPSIRGLTVIKGSTMIQYEKELEKAIKEYSGEYVFDSLNELVDTVYDSRITEMIMDIAGEQTIRTP